MLPTLIVILTILFVANLSCKLYWHDFMQWYYNESCETGLEYCNNWSCYRKFTFRSQIFLWVLQFTWNLYEDNTLLHLSSELPSTVYSSGVARTRVMLGPSSWSLPVERRAAAISPREARKIYFAFIFQLSGWALMAPSCFVLMYEDLCSIRLTCTILYACTHRHVHALTATCMHCRML